MSKNIDRRIVEMSFENQKFEKGIEKSKGSLKRFAESLRGLPKDDFKKLDDSVVSTSKSFSVFREVGIGALRKVGEEAVRVGANMVKALTLDPVMDGWQEMELKLNSTQTIMASTGESLQVVNRYLDELNEYSDRTIYSFSDMTSNIGKFTNAGVNLKLAVASIKGVSNAAALAGADANEASRAMYNFAQALSAGYVKLIDWKSIENANMATVEFKTQLLEAAVAAGTVTKTATGMYQVLASDMSGKKMQQTIDATRNFNESLSFQWMTTEVLTGTLAKYADETTDIGRRSMEAATQVTTFTKLMDTMTESVGSGWAQTFELILGDFNEAKELWTGINKVMDEMIGATADARNELLTGGLASGWKQIMVAGVSDTITFSNTLKEVALTAKAITEETIDEAGSMEKALKGNWLTGEMLLETVTKMADEVEGYSEEARDAAGYTEEAAQELIDLRDAFKSGTLSVEEFAKKMSGLSGRENIIQGLKNAVVALLTVLKPISEAFDQIFPPMTAERLYKATESFNSFTERLIISEKTAEKIKRTFAGLFAVIDIGWQIVKFLGSAIMEVVKTLIPLGGGVLSTTASFGDFLVSINTAIKRLGIFQYGLLAVRVGLILLRNLVVKIASKIYDFAKALWESEEPLKFLQNAAQKVFGKIGGYIEKVTGWFTGLFTKSIEESGEVVEKTFGQKVLGALGKVFKVLKNIGGTVGGTLSKGFKNLGVSLKSIDFDKVTKFVIGGVLLLFVFQISKFVKSSSEFVESLSDLTDTLRRRFRPNIFRELAIAIGVLAGSIWVLSRIPAEDLSRSLITLAKAIGIFVIAYAGVQTINVIASKVLNGADMVKSAFSLVSMASALGIMVVAVKNIAKIDGDVGKAVGVLGALMWMIMAYQTLTVVLSGLPKGKKVSNNILSMSVALLVFSGVMKTLNKMSITEMTSGLAKIASIMLLVAGFETLVALTTKISKGNKLTSSVLGMAAGFAAMIVVIKILDKMDSREITNSIGNLALMTVVIGVFEVLVGLAARIAGGKKLRTQIFSMQFGLLAMTGVIAILGTMKQENITKGLNVISSMMLLIGGLTVLTGYAAKLAAGQKIQKIFGSVTIAMLAFTGIIAILSKFSPEELAQGVITLTALTAIILTIIAVTAVATRVKEKESVKAFGALMGVTVVLLTATAAIALLAMIDKSSLDAATEALNSVLITVAAMAAALGLLIKSFTLMNSNTVKMEGLFKTLLPALTGVVVAMGLTVGLFALIKLVSGENSVSTEDLTKFLTGVTVLSGLLGGFVALLKIIPPDMGTTSAKFSGLTAAMTAVLGVIVATGVLFLTISLVMDTIKSVTMDDMGIFITGIATMTSLMLVMIGMAKPLEVLGKIEWGIFFKGILLALAGLALTIAGFTGIAALLSLVPMDVLITGFDNLAIVGAGIGKFIGSISGGIVEELLGGLGRGLAALFEPISTIDIDTVNILKVMAEAFLAIGAGAVVSGLSRLTNWGKSSSTVFVEQMGDVMKGFAKMNPKTAQKAAAVIIEMEPAAGALAILAKTAGDIPNTGGVSGFFGGNNDIDDFGEMLKKVLDLFSNVPLGQGTRAATILEEMTPMADSLDRFIETANKVPNTGGEAGFWAGNNDIDTFGIMIRKVLDVFTPDGVKLKAGAGAKAAKMLEEMTPMAKNLEVFAEVAGDIPNTGGVSGFFGGNNNIDVFGTQIRKLVEQLDLLDADAVNFAGITLTKMSTYLLPPLESFVELANRIKSVGKGKDLVTLAGYLGDFAKKMEKVDLTVVEPSLEAMKTVMRSFRVLGADVIGNAKKSFEENKEPYQTAIAGILTEPAKKVQEESDAINNSLEIIFELVKKKAESYKYDFRQIGSDLISGLRFGIDSQRRQTVTSTVQVMTSLVEAAKKTTEVNSPSRVFAEIGAWCVKGLAVGITGETKTAVGAGEKMANATEEGIRDALGVHSLSTIFTKIGEWVSTSIGSGITKGKTSLVGIAESLGIDVSKFTMEGMAEGLDGGEGTVTKGINSLLESILGKEGAAVFNDLGSGVGAGIGDSISTSLGDSLMDGTTGMAAQVKTALEILQEWVEEENYYGRLTVEQELQKYLALQKEYKAGSEERKKIDREIYRLTKTIYEGQLTYIEAVQEAQRTAAEERLELEKEYAEEVSKAQAEANEKLADLRKKYDQDVITARADYTDKEHSEDKKYYESVNKMLDEAEKERQSLRETYANNQRSVNEKLLSDIESQNKAYEDAVKSRADSIYGAYGLFDEVTRSEEEVSGVQLLENLRDQGAIFSEWEQSLEALAARGVGTALIEELQNMGPASAEQITALTTLTDEQLDEYVALFEGKYAFARTKATAELEGLKDATIQTIKDLNAQAEDDLLLLELEFEDSMRTINYNLALELAELKDSYIETMDELRFELDDKLRELEGEFAESSNEINYDLAKSLSELKHNFDQSMRDVNENLADSLKDLREQFKTTLREIESLSTEQLTKLVKENKEKLGALNTVVDEELARIEKTFDETGSEIVHEFDKDMDELADNTSGTLYEMQKELNQSTRGFELAGENVAFGFAKGIEGGSWKAITEARVMAQKALAAVNKEIDARSPSRAFAKLGQFASLGFALGIDEYSHKADDAGRKMAEGPIGLITNLLNNLESSVDTDPVWRPKVVPVLDLSDIRSDSMQGLFDTPRVHLSSTSARLAQETGQNGSERAVNSVVITNKFDLHGLTIRSESDIDHIAAKLYQRQQVAMRGRGLR